MKITVEIDCTPVEARQFLGLPDVGPMQERLLVEMEAQMRDALQKLSPDAIAKQWFSTTLPGGLEQMRQAWDKFLKPKS